MRAALLLGVVAALAAGGDGRAASFDCAKIHSTVLKTICASPRLSELDSELSSVYGNMRGQPSVDFTALANDENNWLHTVRDKCANAACIEKAYTARIAVLKEKSLRAASPAAYHETKPFPAPPALLAEAQSYIGKSCMGIWSARSGWMPGFTAPKGFQTVTAMSGMVFVSEKQGTRFAFLTKTGDQSCTFADVAVLPSAAQADSFLQCSYGDPPNISSGVGMRKAGQRKLVGYWEVDGDRLRRQPLGVLGVENTVRCQQPESGD